MVNIIKNKNEIPSSVEIKTQTKNNLTIFFYLTHIKREEIGPLIQFLQKFNINFRRIKNEKQIGLGPRASNSLRKNSNFVAQSSKPISFEEFQEISKFLNTQAIVVGYEYEKAIWNISRTKINLKTSNNFEATWSLFTRIIF